VSDLGVSTDIVPFKTAAPNPLLLARLWPMLLITVPSAIAALMMRSVISVQAAIDIYHAAD
jgi:hypothetical protein